MSSIYYSTFTQITHARKGNAYIHTVLLNRREREKGHHFMYKEQAIHISRGQFRGKIIFILFDMIKTLSVVSELKRAHG